MEVEKLANGSLRSECLIKESRKKINTQWICEDGYFWRRIEIMLGFIDDISFLIVASKVKVKRRSRVEISEE